MSEDKIPGVDSDLDPYTSLHGLQAVAAGTYVFFNGANDKGMVRVGVFRMQAIVLAEGKEGPKVLPVAAVPDLNPSRLTVLDPDIHGRFELVVGKGVLVQQVTEWLSRFDFDDDDTRRSIRKTLIAGGEFVRFKPEVDEHAA